MIDSTSSSTVQLALQEFGFSLMVDSRELVNHHNTSVSCYLNSSLRRHVMQFRHRVYCGRPQKETHSISYPQGWWNAFKAEYPRLCRFFTKPKYHKVTVQWEGRAAFPEVLPLREQYKSFYIWDGPTFNLENDCE